MKGYLAALIITVIAAIIWGRHFKNPSNLDVRCEAELLYVIEREGSKVSLDAMASLFMMANGTGFMNLYGTLAANNKLWMVNRKIRFKWHNELNSNLFDIAIDHSEIKKETDNAPDVQMAKIYNQRFNVEIYEAGPNALYLRGVSTPFFICVRQNKLGKVT